ncbi:ferredoxin-type protein NapG [Helicobacter canadensis]|uniref:MauM/NapG ferredoxin-type protein n=1 Tax=Helicobacter canadensis MIT 98-5491 TaxID=537970 RepID=C5ZXD9_9HELI|nr:ferredoxin-type protein NapG [Helicobacter canadensis]EES89807.1 MauM/NapG ferredoxin-type protein [Helicobacter canadensis MIT 98-5491]EFR48604.1 ferredoxin-type protein NapG [Helicobacter canadensis MIT 98-5491]STO99846.1 NapG ferredoxin-type protein [Helicobacter canadensis]
MDNKNPRRQFFIQAAQAIAMTMMGGLVWSAFLKESRANPLILRPPGALEEKEFLKHCIKCGLCVEACPFDTLKLASAGSGKPIGTPYFIPREIPCEMCPDIPCVAICPTKALEPKLVQSDGIWEINKARMGVAIVDKEHCVAYWGIQCDACYRACPLMGEAIKLELKRNERTGKHSYLLPVVESEVCTGCGKCEKACVTQEAAIIVMPREVALGAVGTNYIKGWESQDEERLEDATLHQLRNSNKNLQEVQDYLNNGEL